MLEFANGKTILRQYWDVPTYGTAGPKSEEEYLEELERQQDDAVRIRLISDVPLGALLSGGVDSSTIVALMARASSRPVKTFTIGFSHEDFNEARAARVVSERFGTEHQELVSRGKNRRNPAPSNESLEEPFADSSILPTYYVSQLTRQHVTVALAGDGGDRKNKLRTVRDRFKAASLRLDFRTGQDNAKKKKLSAAAFNFCRQEDSYSTFHCHLAIAT